MKWKDIGRETPKEESDVFYYFDVFDTVYKGKYKTVEYDRDFTGADPDEFIYGDCFYGEGGFLTDDIKHWMYVPENWDGVLPEKP